MASQRTLDWLDRLTWIFLYGGLLTFVLGLAVRAGAEAPGAATCLITAGLAAAAVGIVLIVVRSRLKPPDR
jgi:steroid 5-alpha reductase family enzyme